MSLTPREILQHMELPTNSSGHPWPGSAGVFILGSLEPVRVSLHSQQVRALNLIYALTCEDRLKEGSRIAILGAGPAGLAAALAAQRVGAHCTVLENAARPLHNFCPNGIGNPRRYVHPSIENWPFQGSDTSIANRLPLMRWEAGTPNQIASGFVAELKKSARQYPTVSGRTSDAMPSDAEVTLNQGPFETFVDVKAKIEHVGLVWSIGFTGSLWNWDSGQGQMFGKAQPKGPRQRDFDFLIYAIGFGGDNISDNAPSYWEDDSGLWKQICDQGGTVMVSGDGDGALIDSVNAALAIKFDPSDQRQLLNSLLVEMPRHAELHRALIALETKLLQQSIDGGKLAQEYFAIEQDSLISSQLHALDKVLFKPSLMADGRFQSNRKVMLVTPGLFPLRAKAFAVNRFLAWRCVRAGLIEHRSGRVKCPSPSDRLGSRSDRVRLEIEWPGGKDERVIAGHDTVEADWRIHRHGAQNPIKKHYPELFSLGEKEIRPKNSLDQTRVPSWPDGFFGSEPRPARRTPVTLVGGAPKVTLHQVRRPDKTASFVEIISEEHFRPLDDDPIKRDVGRWVRCETTATYIIEHMYNGFKLEHQLTKSNPFRIDLTSVDISDGDLQIRLRRLEGAPPWAVAYEFDGAHENKEKPARVALKFSSNPATAFHLADATGFPVFGDMRVKKLTSIVKFINVRPQVWANNSAAGSPAASWQTGVLEARDAVRRLSFEVGDYDGARTPEALETRDDSWIALTKENDAWVSHLTWQPEAGLEFLPQGYFYGVQWDRIARGADDDV